MPKKMLTTAEPDSKRPKPNHNRYIAEKAADEASAYDEEWDLIHDNSIDPNSRERVHMSAGDPNRIEIREGAPDDTRCPWTEGEKFREYYNPSTPQHGSKFFGKQPQLKLSDYEWKCITEFVETDTLPDPRVWTRRMKEEFFELSDKQLDQRWELMQNGPELKKVMDAYKDDDQTEQFTVAGSPAEDRTPVEPMAFGLDKDQTDWDLYDENMSFGDVMRKVVNDTLTKTVTKLNAWIRKQLVDITVEFKGRRIHFKVRLETRLKMIMQVVLNSYEDDLPSIDDDALVFWREGDKYPLWKFDSLLALGFQLHTDYEIKAQLLGDAKPRLMEQMVDILVDYDDPADSGQGFTFSIRRGQPLQELMDEWARITKHTGNITWHWDGQRVLPSNSCWDLGIHVQPDARFYVLDWSEG
jgi:hypothetical protein